MNNTDINNIGETKIQKKIIEEKIYLLKKKGDSLNDLEKSFIKNIKKDYNNKIIGEKVKQENIDRNISCLQKEIANKFHIDKDRIKINFINKGANDVYNIKILKKNTNLKQTFDKIQKNDVEQDLFAKIVLESDITTRSFVDINSQLKVQYFLLNSKDNNEPTFFQLLTNVYDISEEEKNINNSIITNIIGDKWTIQDIINHTFFHMAQIYDYKPDNRINNKFFDSVNTNTCSFYDFLLQITIFNIDYHKHWFFDKIKTQFLKADIENPESYIDKSIKSIKDQLNEKKRSN